MIENKPKVLISNKDHLFPNLIYYFKLNEMYSIGEMTQKILLHMYGKLKNDIDKNGMDNPIIVVPTVAATYIGARKLDKKFKYAVWYGGNRLYYALKNNYTHISSMIVKNQSECDDILNKLGNPDRPK
jgi:hypothetical protein